MSFKRFWRSDPTEWVAFGATGGFQRNGRHFEELAVSGGQGALGGTVSHPARWAESLECEMQQKHEVLNFAVVMIWRMLR